MTDKTAPTGICDLCGSRLQQTLGHGSSKVTLDYYATWDDRHLRDAHKDFSPHDNGGK